MESNKEIFLREYLCKWTPNRAYEEAYKQQILYEYKCESYDRIICSGGIDSGGLIKPRSGEEHRLINVNANRCYKEMIDIIRQYNMNSDEPITNDILQKVKREVSRLTWVGLQNEYRRIQENVEI